MNTETDNKPLLGHPIKVAAQQTGLTPHAIRIWEKRYGAVIPARTPTNRRMYSDEDIERLRLLHKATLTGHSISQVAELSMEQLGDLVQEYEIDPSPAVRSPKPSDNGSPDIFLESAIQAVEQLNARALQNTLVRASAALSQPAIIDKLVVPLMRNIGDLWRDGSLRASHEHLASAVVRTLLGNMETSIEVPETASGIVVGTPAGQLHEIGALICAITAASEGWRVTYLGPNLPAEEIAGAALQNHARAVALSIVYPGDDPHLASELQRLRRCLSEDIAILAGGHSCENYHQALDAIGAVRLPNLLSLRAHLETLRTN